MVFAQFSTRYTFSLLHRISAARLFDKRNQFVPCKISPSLVSQRFPQTGQFPLDDQLDREGAASR